MKKSSLKVFCIGLGAPHPLLLTSMERELRTVIECVNVDDAFPLIQKNNMSRLAARSEDIKHYLSEHIDNPWKEYAVAIHCDYKNWPHFPALFTSCLALEIQSNPVIVLIDGKKPEEYHGIGVRY